MQDHRQSSGFAIKYGTLRCRQTFVSLRDRNINYATMNKFLLRVSNCRQGLEDAVTDLQQGRHRHDVLEQLVRILELDPADSSVGYGGSPNILGEMELDAAFMDGNNRNLGAVAGVKNFLPIKIARRLMEERLHTLLIGAGAEIFAKECGLKQEVTLSEEQRQKWQREIKPLLDSRVQKSLTDLVRRLARSCNQSFDTTISIGSDGNGISGAASTAGWPYKYPGRVGDTPVAGAGLYVDSRYGGCACTWTGEMSMRAGTARYVVSQLQEGRSVRDAVHAGIEDLVNLKDGVLATLVIHGVDRFGNAHVTALNAQESIGFQYWHEDLPKPVFREAERLQVAFPRAVPR
jgi:isoaspartyl peptidase/L-asparaginase-like protein (Ntn-hydrolase superfamily)